MTSPEGVEKLSDELSRLSLEHARAIQDATFLGIPSINIAEFERRRRRISELSALIDKKRLE
jgi:hypothetical protein